MPLFTAPSLNSTERRGRAGNEPPGRVMKTQSISVKPKGSDTGLK